MSTTSWLFMNSNTPSLASTMNRLCPVSFSICTSGSADTPMSLPTAQHHPFKEILAGSCELAAQQQQQQQPGSTQCCKSPHTEHGSAALPNQGPSQIWDMT